MVEGKRRDDRYKLAVQAMLVWADESTDIERFVATGEFEDKVLPFNPVLWEAIVANKTEAG